MERIWLKSYEPHVPADINPEAYPSLVALVQEGAKKFGSAPALTHFDVSLSYEQLDQDSSSFAAYLQQKLKIQKGDRVALMVPNCLQYVVAMFGVLKAGAIVVNVNPQYTPPELIHQLNNSGARVLLVFENFAITVQQALPEIQSVEKIIVTGIGDYLPLVKRCMVNVMVRYVKRLVPAYQLPNTLNFRETLSLSPSAWTPVALVPGDIAFLQYTGGTTGVSKGAVLTHRNMVANIEQSYAWIAPVVDRTFGVIITPLPLYHVFSLMASCLVHIKSGMQNVLITNPRDLPEFTKTWAKHHVVAMMGVNTLFTSLTSDALFAKSDFSHLRIVIAGGMALQGSVAERWYKVTGNRIIQGYGLTESSPIASIGSIYPKEFDGAIGFPVPSTNIKIIDDDGHELPLGEKGELCLLGPQVMKEYWQAPEETAKVLDAEGWLKTGDVARVGEDGRVYIVERKKDMIIISGFNVYPSEVEEVLVKHPNVLECAVIGINSRRTGESIKAFIVTRDGKEIPKAELIAFCRENLTGYKLPRRFEFRTSLPKTNVGKILRRQLREEEAKLDSGQ